MTRLLTPILILALAACDKTHIIDDEAARLRGDYPVQTYIINDDTLYSAGKINKIGVSEFKVAISRKTADTLSIGYFWAQGPKSGSLFVRQLQLSGHDGQYQLTMALKAPLFHEGTISGNVYTERTSLAGAGFVLLPKGYQPNEVSDPTGGTIKIVAQKQ
ncbi:hypothetical protein SAMN04487996_11216 [Dyadobacter soli]|uniref:Uncharacterized protein n=1 Tax=Dyadobacter soli TaxID=659014 RepID=A0A1G7ND48_9BACT|nr:hypothetical protein [Dyadobacter soli]SDF71876.1 hypothetical protein SAMN04487996_11216 [Dyadobacter soli]